jgi:hypothetical protein
MMGSPQTLRIFERTIPETVFLGSHKLVPTRSKLQMETMKMLTELREEREHIEEAIITLERLARGRGKRRGRPPAWMTNIKRRGRPPGSKSKPKDG